MSEVIRSKLEVRGSKLELPVLRDVERRKHDWRVELWGAGSGCGAAWPS